MNEIVPEQQISAAEIIESLRDQVRQLYSGGLNAVVERKIPTKKGLCRVAACASAYGLHFEIGSLDEAAPVTVHVFADAQQEQAAALLSRYLQP
ncbi:MAG: hypothetical protein R3300_21510 [Candidatus Promineifilaceae bacterium]|nr:hypothetical protein [Candidatus Promineifilaceae bacterium]